MSGKKSFRGGIVAWLLRLHLVFAVPVFLSMTAAAQKPGHSSFVTTEVVNGFAVGVTDHNGNTNASPGSVLAWSVFGQGSKPVLVGLPPQPECAFQVQLLDEKSNAVPRTELGLVTGSRFSEVSASSEGIHMQLINATSETNQLTQVMLFRPSDLFRITTPGRYTLRIRFQIVVFFGTPGNRMRRLIRFPPLDYKLLEPGNSK